MEERRISKEAGPRGPESLSLIEARLGPARSS